MFACTCVASRAEWRRSESKTEVYGREHEKKRQNELRVCWKIEEERKKGQGKLRREREAGKDRHGCKTDCNRSMVVVDVARLVRGASSSRAS